MFWSARLVLQRLHYMMSFCLLNFGCYLNLEQISNALSTYFVTNYISFTNIIGCTTDRLSVMVGRYSKFICRLKTLAHQIKPSTVFFTMRTLQKTGCHLSLLQRCDTPFKPFII